MERGALYCHEHQGTIRGNTRKNVVFSPILLDFLGISCYFLESLSDDLATLLLFQEIRSSIGISTRSITINSSSSTENVPHRRLSWEEGGRVVKRSTSIKSIATSILTDIEN